MQRAMIQWRVNSSDIQEELSLLAETYSEMRQLRPEGLVFNTYQLDDRVSFMAFAEMRSGMGVLGGLPAFQRYRASLEARCDQLPVVRVLDTVGLYSAP